MTGLGRRGLLGLARPSSAPADVAPAAPASPARPSPAPALPAPASPAAARSAAARSATVPTASARQATGRAPGAAFSLDDFYARRAAEGPPTDALPRFELRPGLPGVAGTQVGVPELSARAPAPPALSAPPTTLPGPPRVRRSLCLAWQRSPCSACLDRCPVEGALVADEQGKPRVVDERCTACGLCVLACPAPINAFATPDPPEPC